MSDIEVPILQAVLLAVQEKHGSEAAKFLSQSATINQNVIVVYLPHSWVYVWINETNFIVEEFVRTPYNMRNAQVAQWKFDLTDPDFDPIGFCLGLFDPNRERNM
ncbi:MAG: hypothetical protein Q8K86_06990 [Candidatus Nanopelagicaceae bacterium]|nr:hypothetical protein [Candidatus Nanopelagicaceae bacterium]